MSNRTVSGAKSIHGTDPQLLIEKIIRERIYSSRYWKEKCFGLDAESLVDRAVELTHLGGTFGGHQKPCEFLCLLLKCLQIQPSDEIIREYMAAEEYKYLRCLGAMYWRMTKKATQIYPILEEFLSDFRKIRVRNRDGSFSLKRIDEIIDGLLKEDRMFDTILPRITKRFVLEEKGEVEVRKGLLDAQEITELEAKEEETEQPLIEEEESVEVDEVVGSVGKREKWKPESKKKKQPISDQPQTTSTNAGTDNSLDEENALRARLGLKPLQP